MKHSFSGYSKATAHDFPSNANCNGRNMEVRQTDKCDRRVCYKPDHQVCSREAGPMCDCVEGCCLDYCDGECKKCCECPSKHISEKCFNETLTKQ